MPKARKKQSVPSSSSDSSSSSTSSSSSASSVTTRSKKAVKKKEIAKKKESVKRAKKPVSSPVSHPKNKSKTKAVKPQLPTAVSKDSPENARSTSSSSSASSVSSKSKKKVKKKKSVKKKEPTKRVKSPVSPSVSHPLNRNKLKAVEPPLPSSVSKENSENVLPLLMENVTSHTEKVRHAVNKDNTVAAFLRTINDAQGQYSINTMPDIVSIPTPMPEDPKENFFEVLEKKSVKSQPAVTDKSEELSHAHMYKEKLHSSRDESITTKQNTSTKPTQEVAITDSSDEDQLDNKPLDYDGLQKTFEVLKNINHPEYGTAEEFKKWCKDNRERFEAQMNEVTEPPKQPKPRRNLYSPPNTALHQRLAAIDDKNKTDNQESPIPSKPSDSGYYSRPTPTADTAPISSEKLSGRPKMVSKSTSGAQTEEHPVESFMKFKAPEVLMLDSYTQTCEEDRLKTLPIRCRHRKVDSETNTGVDATRNENSHKSETTSKSQSELRMNEASTKKNVSFEEERRQHTKSPVEFILKKTCRHGNERATCDSCIHGAVKPKYQAPTVASKKVKAEQQEEQTTSRIAQQEDIADYKDENNDSGQELDTPPPPVVSTVKLAKIKHLARAKLKQIRHSDDRMSRSVDRTPLFASDNENYDKEKQKKRKNRIQNGIESFGIEDLPPLVSSGWESRPTDSSMNKVYRLKEEKRVTDVSRAKQYIQHCLDTPIEDEPFRHKPRQHIDERSSSLPRFKSTQRCDSEATRRSGGISDDVESRKCVSEVQSGQLRRFDVNYKAYINALERIVDSNLTSLARAKNYNK